MRVMVVISRPSKKWMRDHGVHLHEKGYLRFHTKENRHKYWHRVVMERLIGRPLRRDEDVHHQCFNRSCRNPEHWILMDAVLHEKGQSVRPRRDR